MRELLKQALDALDHLTDDFDGTKYAGHYSFVEALELIPLIRAKLAKPVQEPVAWLSWHDTHGKGYWDTFDEAELNSAGDHEPEPLYAAPVDCLCNRQMGYLGTASGEYVDHVNCSRHPAAPHGFDRNGSHNAGRYMCVCENWSSGDAS